MRFDERDLRRVAWLRRRRELETRRMARTRAQQRDQRAADHDARIHRCGGCGQWLYGPMECDVCLRISQLHERDAHSSTGSFHTPRVTPAASARPPAR